MSSLELWLHIGENHTFYPTRDGLILDFTSDDSKNLACIWKQCWEIWIIYMSTRMIWCFLVCVIDYSLGSRFRKAYKNAFHHAYIYIYIYIPILRQHTSEQHLWCRNFCECWVEVVIQIVLFGTWATRLVGIDRYDDKRKYQKLSVCWLQPQWRIQSESVCSPRLLPEILLFITAL